MKATKIKDTNWIWLEIENTENKKMLLSRIDKLNKFCRMLGVITEHQKFFLLEDLCSHREEQGRKKPDALIFIHGKSGCFTYLTDWGKWFNLDYITSDDKNNFPPYQGR